MSRAVALLSLLLLAACEEPTDGTEPLDTAETDTLDLTGQPAELSNTPADCKHIALVAPVLPGEADSWFATRLRPLAWPATITDVAYGLPHEDDCDAGLAHAVIIFAVDAGVPVGDPLSVPGAQYRDVKASPESAGLVPIELHLDEPITLLEGQDLFIAVQTTANADASASLCIAACTDGGGTPGVNWWSETTEAPFNWSDLVADLGFTHDLMVTASGTY